MRILGIMAVTVSLGIVDIATLPTVGAAQIETMEQNAAGDYEAISRLVVWERQSRVRHETKEMEACYFPDATVATSWSRGTLASYLKGGNRAEAAPDEIIL